MYIRDCKNTENFEKNFLKPFVAIQIRDYKNDLLEKFEDKFGYENEYFEFIRKLKFEKYDI